MIEVTELKRLFSYDPETGEVRNRLDRGRARVGELAGSLNGEGYRTVGIGGKQYRMHRIAWALHYGDHPHEDMHVDHINRVRDDNRIVNLRLATPQQNQWNQGQRAGRALPVGVSWRKRERKYRAQIWVSGKSHFLGLHTTAEAAHEAYLAAKAELHRRL